MRHSIAIVPATDGRAVRWQSSIVVGVRDWVSIVSGRVVGCCFAGALAAADVAAQEQVTICTEVLLYGDNTEFHNPFREGETVFGAAARVAARIDLGQRVTLALGAFGHQRFGSDDAFEQARPVVSLTVRGARSSFVLGTLPGPTTTGALGPDRGGPHGLLPSLQRDTLWYDRPYEAGLAWTFAGASLEHRAWLAWQRLNTASQRERFDVGFTDALRVSDHASLLLQGHIVHEGGQLFAVGPVRDSAALAAGVGVHGTFAKRWRASLDVLGAVSRFVPDRERPDLDRDGTAVFGRGTIEHRGWRGHLIAWRGRNFLKDEGDPNYLSITRRSDRYRGTRDYAEAGVTRRFTLAPAAILDVSARFHRVERHYEYSYRIVSIVTPSWRVR